MSVMQITASKACTLSKMQGEHDGCFVNESRSSFLH